MKFYNPDRRLYTQEWIEFTEHFNCRFVIDRTESVTDFGFDYVVHTPIPKDWKTDKTFEQIADEEGARIAAEHDNILLIWSGGIDSTVAFIALLKTGVPFTVGGTVLTREEYPLLYQQLKNNHWGNHITWLDLVNQEANELQTEYHMVTGSLGDQIIGSAKVFTTLWQDLMVPVFKVDSTMLEPYSSENAGFDITMLEPVIAASPIPIVDMADFWWWMSFTLKWQWVEFMFVRFVNMDPTLPHTNFFGSDDFQRWGMSNRELNKRFLYTNKPAEYKQVYKEYIYDVLGDAEYLKNKLKLGSLRSDQWAFRHTGRSRSEIMFGPMIILGTKGNMIELKDIE